MTAEATLPTTSASPTARQVWTRARGILLALVILLAAAVAIAAIRSDARHGDLDPRSADPYGSRAVAELLGDRGVSTRVVTTLAQARAAAGPDTTLLVAVPDLLTKRQQSGLHSAFTDSGSRTVLVAPGAPSLDRLAPEVTADPGPALTSALSHTYEPTRQFWRGRGYSPVLQLDDLWETDVALVLTKSLST